MTPSSQLSWTYPSTSGPLALQDAVGSGRIESVWYSTTSFSVNVDLTDGQSHVLSIYADDYDKQDRDEQIQISDGTTGAVLSSVDLSTFSQGAYLKWTVKGDIVVTVTNLGTLNSVISGLFLDAPASTPAIGERAPRSGQTIAAQGGTHEAAGHGLPCERRFLRAAATSS